MKYKYSPVKAVEEACRWADTLNAIADKCEDKFEAEAHRRSASAIRQVALFTK